MRMAGVMPAGGGIIAAMFGPGLPRATADPTEKEIVELSIRYAQTTCAQLAALPKPQGVRAAVADVLDRSAVPRSAAERVVGLAVKNSCPQYLPLVQQVVPDFS
jgi:hypothetical protein